MPIAQYATLGPELILDAVESLGLRCSARILALNSYENRVYQVGLEDSAPVVVKFYRPGRWSDEQILEEHRFTLELADLENPVVAPLVLADGRSLHHFGGFRFAVYPRQGGHTPELSDPEHLHRIGRALGRIHALGAVHPFRARPDISLDSYVHEPARFILEHDFIPGALLPAYQSLLADLLPLLREFMTGIEYPIIRLHGDCYPSNILWADDGPHLVDFDDCRNGPAVQDVWMFLSGHRDERQGQLCELLDGYGEFHDFNPAELGLIESLRTMRLIHYAGWLARRWDDPAFPRSFPWFNTPRYWEEHILTLREQYAALQEEPLRYL
ncbi:MAG: stress response serine/threonine protein kinase YihE [Gammaproteobacteria bacterium RBG_16_57_12]|nr:MAG: stress response serine/threonine protein kinase YihE [Gammaproteobacteria bacterium RBG_16_57_12]